MIEIVYDKQAAEKNMKQNTHYKLPKNIRQIGNTPDKRKIYIEDYVMTYLRKIAEPGNTTSRGAILLGDYFKDEETDVLFISGAVEAQNLEFDVDQIKFDDHIWSGLYAEINKYFENLSVVGWFLSRMGFSTEINEKITKLHLANFKGRDKVLFVMDSLECEDAFYVSEKNHLIRQRGYYIYYVRNEAMQNYIISRKNMTTEDRTPAALRKDAEIVKNFRAMREEPATQKEKRKKKSYARYAVASVAAIFALSMGVIVSGNYDKMKDIESTIRKNELENNESDVQVFSESNSEKTIYTEDIDTSTTGEQTEETTEIMAENTTEQAASSAETAETGASSASAEVSEDQQETMSNENVEYYTIEEGDTLMSISLKMYDSPNYVDELMEANEMQEGDTIYPGEKIAIPSVEK